MNREIKYKVVFGYGDTDYITIDRERDLMKAYAAFINQTPLLLQSGEAIERVKYILPDWNATMGWNHGYKITGQDMGEVGVKRIQEAKFFLANAATAVRIAIKENKPHILELPTSAAIMQVPERLLLG